MNTFHVVPSPQWSEFDTFILAYFALFVKGFDT